MEHNPGDCAHCGEPIFGDVQVVMGQNMHPKCAEDFQAEYAVADALRIGVTCA